MLHLFVVLAQVQRLEVGNAVNPEHYGLAINDQMVLPDLARGLDDPGVSIGPIVATARDQPHGIARALEAQAKPVIFDFMDPVLAGGDDLSRRRKAESKGACMATRYASRAKLVGLARAHPTPW